MIDYIVPSLLLLTAAITLRKGQDPYQLMLRGAAEGLGLLKSIFPVLILLLTGITMLRASGAVELMSRLLGPLLRLVGIPEETALLVLVRPISGSAALAVGAELIAQHGADSEIGRTVAVMLGSTETTFYTVSVYFGAAGIKQTRYTLPAALIADLTGFITAALWTRLLFP